MTPERWQRVEELYHAALSRPEAERAEFLRAACGADEALQREVASLLAQAASGDGGLTTGGAMTGVRSTETQWSLIGRRLGAYVLQAQLGAGAMDI